MRKRTREGHGRKNELWSSQGEDGILSEYHPTDCQQDSGAVREVRRASHDTIDNPLLGFDK